MQVGYWQQSEAKMPDDAPNSPPRESPKKDPDKSGMATFGRYFGVAMVLPIASMMGYGIGYELDQHFATHWMAITLLVLGTVGGFIQLIREITR